MRQELLEASFGDVFIVNLPNVRHLLYAGSITVGNISKFLFYPLSFQILMATDRDFMCAVKNLNSSVILELWNPIYTDNIDITPFSSIEDDYISSLTRFIYYDYLNLPFAEKRFYTGPPIRSNTDIRLLFQQQEKKLFLPCSSETLSSIQLIQSFLPSI